MYDYRGFGQSDDFEIVQNQLFHMEFVKDLDAVAKYVYQKTGKGKQVIKTFDCEHISGFFRYPEEYTTAIVDFLK